MNQKQPIKIWRFQDAPEQYRQAEPEGMWNNTTWLAAVPSYLWSDGYQFLLFNAWLDVHQGNGFSCGKAVSVAYDDEIMLIFGDG